MHVLGGGGTEQKGRRTYGHGQQCGDCSGEGCIRGLKGNGKNTIKNKSFKYKKQIQPGFTVESHVQAMAGSRPICSLTSLVLANL